MNLPFISLDTLYWGPNWREATRDEFCANVRAALDKSPHGWVIDGNYTNKLGGLITDSATDIICEPHPQTAGALAPELLLTAPGPQLLAYRVGPAAAALLPAAVLADRHPPVPARASVQPGVRGEGAGGVLLARQHHLVVRDI